MDNQAKKLKTLVGSSKKDRNVCIANFCLHDEIGFSYNKIKIKKDKFKQFNKFQKYIFNNLIKV